MDFRCNQDWHGFWETIGVVKNFIWWRFRLGCYHCETTLIFCVKRERNHSINGGCLEWIGGNRSKIASRWRVRRRKSWTSVTIEHFNYSICCSLRFVHKDYWLEISQSHYSNVNNSLPTFVHGRLPSRTGVVYWKYKEDSWIRYHTKG